VRVVRDVSNCIRKEKDTKTKEQRVNKKKSYKQTNKQINNKYIQKRIKNSIINLVQERVTQQ
jgi:hypothetical protein